ncbi:MAG: SDR family oxidoreductase [Candidatus Stygibacter frigidus]|nr:SDR family oxidoreductase [Candidatus Stygibacter frigidus]
MNNLPLQNKVIVITGASGGIGNAIAQIAVEDGASVCLFGRNKIKLKNLMDSLPQGRNKFYELDLSQEDEIKAKINDIKHEYGRIDGFVHAAGFELTKPLRKTSKADFLHLYEINTISSFSFIREILKQKSLIHNPLSFIIISSIMSTLGERGKIAYCASKGAISSAVKALSLEIAAQGHRVNCVSPGMVETNLTSAMMKEYPSDVIETIKNQHPLGFGQPSDVAFLVSFLLSEKARWITGSNIIIDGGYSAK